MTFQVSLELLLFANSAFLRHVETIDKMLVEKYATMPAETQPPIRVKRNLRIVDGYHRLAAAKKRGDVDVCCCSATMQEELSF